MAPFLSFIGWGKERWAIRRAVHGDAQVLTVGNR